jgi:hypothetical protein
MRKDWIACGLGKMYRNTQTCLSLWEYWKDGKGLRVSALYMIVCWGHVMTKDTFWDVEGQRSLLPKDDGFSYGVSKDQGCTQQPVSHITWMTGAKETTAKDCIIPVHPMWPTAHQGTSLQNAELRGYKPGWDWAKSWTDGGCTGLTEQNLTPGQWK